MKVEDLTYEQCVAQRIGPLLFPERLEMSQESSVESRERIAQMKAVCVHNMQMQAQIYRIQEQAWRALESAGIKAVLMKGAGLAALYPSPERRQWGDVDIYVGKEQYHAAAKVMRETFPDALKFDEELEHYKHYNLIADGVAIEIHRVSVSLTHPRDIRRYERFETEGLTMSDERLTISGLEMRVPEPTFNVLMVLLHSWEHVLTKGANVRQLCDLAFLLEHYKDRIDWKRLKTYLRQLCLEDVWELYQKCLVDFIGMSVNCQLFVSIKCYKNAEMFWEDLIQGERRESRAESRETRVGRNRLVRKWGTMKARMKKTKRIERYSPAYARHMRWGILLSGAKRLFAKDRKWE